MKTLLPPPPLPPLTFTPAYGQEPLIDFAAIEQTLANSYRHTLYMAAAIAGLLLSAAVASAIE